MFRHRLSISSWSLHRCLGPLRWTVWDESSQSQGSATEAQPSEFSLLELPAIAASRGLSCLELCHFHFPSRDDAYLRQLKQAFAEAGVIFHTLLVDYGDISSPDPVRRESDFRYLKEWVDAAAIAGASAVRIVAGEQSPDDAASISRGTQALLELSEYAAGKQVRIVTENFRSLTSTVSSWKAVMEGAGPSISTIVDFGNLAKHEKEEGIRYGAPLAHSIHAKPEYEEDGSIREDRLLELLRMAGQANREAPVSIIFDREGDMWEGIERIKAVILKLDEQSLR
ncbi:sugar phosphate isomerase/epimerase family protein [Paenibacillus soyae]|uniref:Sugar phosphate isomerase/epimerase n=1 Tax=Paenibacillus soyae TaxID=2969249 RepID=A0A9X2MV18_9BACL|nr:sugar phosphate isomerase/epimerase [Paenibacillus soyae]MCR2806386.1 sugar phosphate isomerase/epimerase [Paenibacillus soyae]